MNFDMNFFKLTLDLEKILNVCGYKILVFTRKTDRQEAFGFKNGIKRFNYHEFYLRIVKDGQLTEDEIFEYNRKTTT
jgi:hypothetical protein